LLKKKKEHIVLQITAFRKGLSLSNSRLMETNSAIMLFTSKTAHLNTRVIRNSLLTQVRPTARKLKGTLTEHPSIWLPPNVGDFHCLSYSGLPELARNPLSHSYHHKRDCLVILSRDLMK